MTVTTNGAATATTYCYDKADRLLSSSDPLSSTPIYDAHGNTTQLGSTTATNGTKTVFAYDSSDRNTGITETGVATVNGTTTTTTKQLSYTRDVQGRITSRTSKLNGTVQSDMVYGFTASGDTPVNLPIKSTPRPNIQPRKKANTMTWEPTLFDTAASRSYNRYNFETSTTHCYIQTSIR